jgi:hypothetical protein
MGLYHVGELVVSKLIHHIFLAVVFLDDVIRGEEVFLALGIIRCAEFFAVFDLPKDNKL